MMRRLSNPELHICVATMGRELAVYEPRLSSGWRLAERMALSRLAPIWAVARLIAGL